MNGSTQRNAPLLKISSLDDSCSSLETGSLSSICFFFCGDEGSDVWEDCDRPDGAKSAKSSSESESKFIVIQLETKLRNLKIVEPVQLASTTVFIHCTRSLLVSLSCCNTWYTYWIRHVEIPRGGECDSEKYKNNVPASKRSSSAQ